MSCSAAALSQNPGSGSLFGVLDTMTMILPSCVFMAGIVSSTEHEQDLVRAFVEELYARVPTAGIGSMWQFCELLWKLRPAVEADIDVSNISPTEYYTYKDQGTNQPVVAVAIAVAAPVEEVLIILAYLLTARALSTVMLMHLKRSLKTFRV